MDKQKFINFFNTNLNQSQQEAVSHNRGSLLVVAGAGSGKTRVITTRIINLMLNHLVSSENILALTFTNKAAHEMKERIHEFLPDFNKPFVGTFHAYCLQLLKTHNDLLDFSTFSILDTDDQQLLLSSIIKRAGFEKRMTAKNLSYQISNLKNSLPKIDNDLNTSDSIIQQLYREYEREKKASKCLDFDDLLLETLNIFDKNKAFKKKFQHKVRHILVDEYQDTNIVQHALLKAMAKQKSLAIDSVCVVGDEDQSIYSWRGATVANILNFKKDFPKSTVIKIEQNYRSAQPILSVANNVIEKNQNRNPKNLWSTKQGNDRVRSLQCMSGYQESEAIALATKQLRKKEGEKTVAILYRAHYQSRTIEEALIRYSIPYKIIGGIQFYERKEIKDMLAYLRLIANPFDRISFFRIINCPTRGLGEKFKDIFYQAWNNQPFLTFIDCAKYLIEINTTTGIKRTTLENFIDLFKNKKLSDSPTKTLNELLQTTNYFSYLKHSFDPQEAETKIENIKELLRATSFFEQSGITTIGQFLDEVVLMQEKSITDDQQHNEIKLMTLHAAKGLEFDMVSLSGLEEGIFPSSRSTYQNDSLEEERRLFYVGITRAKEYLLITHARYRYTFGTMTDQLSSRFVREIPKNLAPKIDISYWNDVQLMNYFAEWFNINVPTQVLTFGSALKEKQPKQQKKNNNPPWKINQTINHKKFGIGIIKKVDQRNSEEIFITAKFKSGIKKIKSSFLDKI